jgi:hypothetical protein
MPRKPGVPASVRDLDHDRVVAALVVCNMNVTAAARRLHVPSSDLRRLMNANPDLLALAAEKEERRLDKAEAILDRELASDSAAAAFFVLRNAKRAVARGWRQPDVEVTVQAPAKTYVFKWEGDDLGETVIERDGKSIPVLRYERGDDCLEGEAAASPVLIEHAPEPQPVLLEPEPEPASPSLPVWPGPGLPPPLVAHLYAPYSPPPVIHREPPPPARPAVLRRRLRGV